MKIAPPLSNSDRLRAPGTACSSTRTISTPTNPISAATIAVATPPDHNFGTLICGVAAGRPPLPTRFVRSS